MDQERKQTITGAIPRRSFLHSLLLLAGASLASCTPARALFGLYDDRFDTDTELTERYLRAFVLTIIPGAPASDPSLTRIFFDPAFAFAEHRGLFTADLARRSRGLLGTDRFDALSESDRARVVTNGLDASAITSALYRGAILAAQVSFYGSIYDDDGACSMIDFPGANAGFDDDVMYHRGTSGLVDLGLTSDGNYS